MWVALLTGAALQAAVWAKTPDIVACEATRRAAVGICRHGSCQPCMCRYGTSNSRQQAHLHISSGACHPGNRTTLHMPRLLPSLQSQRADMSGSDVAVASFAVLYLRARSWGLPAALVMMVAIGAAR